MEKYISSLSDNLPVLIGFHEREAFACLAKNKLKYRIMERNGKTFNVCTKHYYPDRFNLIIKDSIVDKYLFF